ncbi:MAG: hypothetical protein MZU79_04625 [Anaerotruncus sp.]|nr:hypothetical protein [Anaerotruncus sp.]
MLCGRLCPSFNDLAGKVDRRSGRSRPGSFSPACPGRHPAGRALGRELSRPFYLSAFEPARVLEGTFRRPAAGAGRPSCARAWSSSSSRLTAFLVVGTPCRRRQLRVRPDEEPRHRHPPSLRPCALLAQRRGRDLIRPSAIRSRRSLSDAARDGARQADGHA